MRGHGDPYGLHRVLDVPKVFPQVAERLDASLPLYSHEVLLHVETLNVDSASFHQFLESTPGQNPDLLKRKVIEVVKAHGKLHNPVTNSGGMLLGRVAQIGKDSAHSGFSVGERLVTLVSLTLTPLHLESIEKVDMVREQLSVKGHAILFESGSAHRLPPDLPEPVSLGVFDVCGAPALTSQLAHVGQTVIILGAGKAGLLVAAEARRKVGRNGKVIVLEKSIEAISRAQSLSFVDEIHEADLQDSLRTFELVKKMTHAHMADLVINCVNVQGTEMSSILAAKKSGTVLFFNMATRFQAAVLGAEGIGHETRLIMGNGYFPWHAELALLLVRENPALRTWFEKKFS